MSKRKAVPLGQAVLEYLLLLVIVLAILGGVVYQFNDAFRVYSKKLFVGEDSYIGCLIKNGILPGADSEACPRPQFNLADGKRLPGTDLNGGGNSQNSNASANNSAPASGRSTGTTSGTIGFNSADQKNAGLKSDSLKGNTKNGAPKNSTGNDGFSSGAPTTSQGEGDSGNSSGSFANNRGRKPITTEESIQEKAAASVPLTARDMKSARELAAEKKKKSKTIDDASSTDFSFSNIFKYLVIAALVFGIIFFIGSQFLAISRSKRRK